MRKIKLFSAFVLTAALSSCAAPPPVSKSAFLLDTYVFVRIYAPTAGASEILDECLELCERYDALFDRNDEQSDVYRLNHADGELALGADTLEILEIAKAAAEKSDGAFDVTIGGVSELWDFKADEPRLPDSSELTAALTTVGYRNIVLNGGSASRKNGAAIDLGGIAKGYIADKMADYLRSRGITSAVVSLGGDIVTVGAKPRSSKWAIGIQKPFGVEGETAAVLHVSEKSIVSSGNYERYFVLDDKLYHHIFDTKTGYPVNSGLSSVTIISDKSVDGDWLSTSCFALGLERGLALVSGMEGIGAVFITEDGEIYLSDGFGAVAEISEN